MDITVDEAMPECGRESCEACVGRDLVIATMQQQLDLLRSENQRQRQRIAEVIRILGAELLTR